MQTASTAARPRCLAGAQLRVLARHVSNPRSSPSADGFPGRHAGHTQSHRARSLTERHARAHESPFRDR